MQFHIHTGETLVRTNKPTEKLALIPKHTLVPTLTLIRNT